MGHLQNLEKLRPLGKLEQVSAACHHLGFYNNVGLSARYKLSGETPTSNLKGSIYSALASVIKSHPILSAVPVDEDSANPYFASLPPFDLTKSVFFIQRKYPLLNTNDGQDQELDEILQDQHNTNFKAHYGALPFWRLLIVQEKEGELEFTASFIFHHAIGDGMAGLVFHRAFKNALEVEHDSPTTLDFDFEKLALLNKRSLLPPLEELHPLLMNPNPPKPPPTPPLKEWTGDKIRAPCITRYRTVYLSSSTSQALLEVSKRRGFSITAILPSIIAGLLFDIVPSTIEALTCIIPVSLRPWLSLPRDEADSAIGTYIDAFKVQFRRPEQDAEDAEKSIWTGAQQISEEVVRYLQDNLSPSGEPYTAVAVFKNIPDLAAVFNSTLGNPRDAAFEVSNLGAYGAAKEDDRASKWGVGRMTFSRSSVVSGAAVTLSVVSGGDGALTIGFSWQKGVIEDGLVERLIDGTKERIESLVRSAGKSE
ncbi:hypothetical protein IQ07DRAFT_684112 [Pyrenochaeta sp. DS3sAY3a]|nr:hypothetical protein IQ07DRAFT_684112 [Pyrenochaeta sp. DS3sAY3a]